MSFCVGSWGEDVHVDSFSGVFVGVPAGWWVCDVDVDGDGVAAELASVDGFHG